jgi:hypothetical protein
VWPDDCLKKYAQFLEKVAKIVAKSKIFTSKLYLKVQKPTYDIKDNGT